jgi:hypothetical protein
MTEPRRPHDDPVDEALTMLGIIEERRSVWERWSFRLFLISMACVAMLAWAVLVQIRSDAATVSRTARQQQTDDCRAAYSAAITRASDRSDDAQARLDIVIANALLALKQQRLSEIRDDAFRSAIDARDATRQLATDAINNRQAWDKTQALPCPIPSIGRD